MQWRSAASPAPRRHRARIPLVQMIGQSERDAVAQRCFVDLVVGAEQDAAIAAIAPFVGIEFTESRDQIGLAMEIERILFAGHMIDADGAAAFGFGREVTGLAPFQGFLDPADPSGGFGGIKNQPAQRQ
jgi:hypothetical protein